MDFSVGSFFITNSNILFIIDLFGFSIYFVFIELLNIYGMLAAYLAKGTETNCLKLVLTLSAMPESSS